MKKAHFSILISLIFCIVFISHWMVFLSVDFFWSIEASLFLIIFLSILLPGLFFVATAVMHRRESPFSRWLYLVFSTWLGLFSFLFFSVFSTWGIFWLGILFSWDIPVGIIFSFLAFSSFVFVVYGIWNAFSPRVRQIDVFIRNLPLYWEGKRIVQISDVHLGAVYGAKHFRKIAMMANAEKPEIVVFTGDTFDGTDGWLSTFIEPIRRVRAKSGIFFIIGNHETYLGVEKTKRILKDTNLCLLDNAIAEVEGVKIVGLSYPERGKRKRFVQILKKLFPDYQGYPTILLNHTPEQIKKISQMGISLQLSGHTHFGQMTPFNIVTHFMHKGFDYGKFEIGDYTLYTTNGVGTWGPPIRFGNTPEIVSVTVYKKPDSVFPTRRRNGIVRSAQRVVRGVRHTTNRVRGATHTVKRTLKNSGLAKNIRNKEKKHQGINDMHSIKKIGNNNAI